MNLLRMAGYPAMIGASVFVAVFTLEGFIRPGYDARASHISALSLGRRGWIQIANFIMLGALLGLVAWGLWTRPAPQWAWRTGVIMLACMAALFVISGVSVMDPASTPRTEASVHGMIHGLAGGIIFLLMPITMFVFLVGFGADPEWQSMPSWTLGLGVIEAVAVLVFILVSKGPALQDALSAWVGLIQRAALMPFMFWLFVFGVELVRHTQ